MGGGGVSASKMRMGPVYYSMSYSIVDDIIC